MKFKHSIKLKEDFVPTNCKIYLIAPGEQSALDKFIDENLQKGYIRPSKLEMASPFFFISKKNMLKMRPIMDYRRLNKGTIRDPYPLPQIDTLQAKLANMNIFSKYNIKGAYNLMEIEEDKWKGAFKTNRGLFEPNIMFFRMCNSPTAFQWMMDKIFKEEIAAGWLFVYLDSILIVSEQKIKIKLGIGES